jgi:TolB-like protein/DNA-binding winged helix-turn-helix (wHTH) protein/cytochrome c-type biogenesis protein CcmH/NrfG
VRFGAFELDLSTGELRSIEAPDPDNPGSNNSGPNNKVLLREQVFQVLRMLLEREGKIVTREEIKGRLWPNDTVGDFNQSINANIKALRRALGDSADNPRYIETLARRGYRLIPTIECLESASGATLGKDNNKDQREPSAAGKSHNAARVQAQIRSSGWKTAVVLASVVISASGGLIWWRHFRDVTPPQSQKIMVAVLPFENLTGDPRQDYLADGLTEETISQLGRLNPEELGVIARTSVMRYKHTDERLDQIGRDLSVQYVMENSLRESGDHMRLTAQLIQVKDQSQLWSQDYDYPLKDILNVEDDVAKAVAREIRLRLTAQQQTALSRPHPVNPEAFEAYMQGYYFYERNTNKDAGMATQYYERATQLDPSYALAWVGLSRARYWQADKGLIPTEEGQRLAREADERALALDPNLPQAHAQMGRIKRQLDLDWAGAEASVQRAIALEPGNSEYVRSAAFTAAMLGRFDEALKLAHRAVDLDPLNAESWENLGETRFWAGQIEESVADFKKALELSPDVWLGWNKLAQIHLMQGRPQDALREVDRAQWAALRIRMHAMAYHALGREKESDAALRELIEKLHSSAAFSIATVYAFRNQRDEAFQWLDRAYAQHDTGLITTKVEPLLSNLHGDPRYAVFLKKLNLPA